MVRPRDGRPGWRAPSARRSSTASSREPRRRRRLVGRDAQEPRSSRSRGARPTGSCTTTSSDHWAPVWFADFVERAAGARARLRRRRRPHQPAARARAGRGRATRWTSSRAATGSPTSRSSTCCAASSSASRCCAATAARPADAPDAAARARRCTSRRASGAEATSSRRACSARRWRCCARARPTRSPFAELRAALGADPDELAEAMLEGFLRRAGDAARCAAAGGRRRPGSSGRSRARSRAGRRARRRRSRASPTRRVHMEEPAARLLLHAARRHARPRGDPGRVPRAHRRAAVSAEDLDANLVQLGRLFLLVGVLRL